MELRDPKLTNYFLSWCLTIILVSLSVTTIAQEKDSIGVDHSIALQFGVNQIKDENLHPKVSTGTITRLSYGFEKRNKYWRQFHVLFGYGRLKTTLEDLSKSINISMHIDYSWNFHLVQKKKFQYYLGPEANFAYNFCYFPNWDDSHLYWADHFSIGVRNNFSIRFKNENEWLAFVSIPLFSVFSRPDLYRLYKIDDVDFGGIMHNLNSNLTPGHLVNVFYVHFQTEYRFPVFKSKTQAFTFTTEYLRVKHDDGNPYAQLTYQIGIKLLL